MSAPLIFRNLKKIKKAENKEKVLYEGPGTNATSITLNDDISNYDEYEVDYSLNSANGAVKCVRAKSNEAVALDGSLTGYFNEQYYAIRLIATSAYVAGNVLHKSVGYVQDLAVNGSLRFSDTANAIYIKRVIGYKN